MTQHWTEIDWSPHVQDAEVGGRKLRYVDYGEGPPLVLIHGLGGAWQWWLECLPALGRERRVVAVDLPGFGNSDAFEEPGTMDDHADAVFALMEQLDLPPATVGGHSMGGLVTLSLAERHPERVERVLLVNAGGVPMSPGHLAVVVKLLGAAFAPLSSPVVQHGLIHRRRLRKTLLPGAGPRTQEMSPELASELVPLMASPSFMDAIVAAGSAVSATEPENVMQPARLIWGDRDPIVKVANAQDMERRMPDAHLTLIKGVSHSPMIERPDELVEAILA